MCECVGACVGVWVCGCACKRKKKKADGRERKKIQRKYGGMKSEAIEKERGSGEVFASHSPLSAQLLMIFI